MKPVVQNLILDQSDELKIKEFLKEADQLDI